MLAITSLLFTMNIPSDAHFASSANIQHSTPKQNMFPRMRTSSSTNIHTQYPTPKQNIFS